MMTKLETKPYLEYLDKEMAIMGILSAVSVIAPGGILSALLAGEKGTPNAAGQLWNSCSGFILAGATFCIVSALYFYKERSTLAWFYGQICLKEALNPTDFEEIQNWLKDADSWEAWWPYSCAFTLLIAGFVEYLLASVFYLFPGHWRWLSSHLWGSEVLCFLACPLLSVPVALLQRHAMTKYKFSEDYWEAFRSDLFSSKDATFRSDVSASKDATNPHDHVYARLAPSKKHGVGVFAIQPIPEGTYVFEPDDDPTVKIRFEDTTALAPEIRRLYEDFCVLKEGFYECPMSFNQLTPAWYFNHSETPNVAPDSSLKFFATRQIGVGEELTANYNTYSESEPERKDEFLEPE